MSDREGMTEAEYDVFSERRRQIKEEGWSPAHDDRYVHGQLAEAAACYAIASRHPEGPDIPLHHLPANWPWDESWWKPTDRRRMLVKAGALILAEIERLDRMGEA